MLSVFVYMRVCAYLCMGGTSMAISNEGCGPFRRPPAICGTLRRPPGVRCFRQIRFLPNWLGRFEIVLCLLLFVFASAAVAAYVAVRKRKHDVWGSSSSSSSSCSR